MATNLDSLFAQSSTDSTGVGKDETGTVTIQSSDNQPVQIQTSSSATAIQVNDDATINLNLGVAVNEILNSFNAATTGKDKKLATVQAIVSYFTDNYSGLNQFNFNSIADYNAYTFVEAEMPAQVYISDSTPFNFTDDYGESVTGASWVLIFLHWDVSSVETHLMSSSEGSNQLTASDIKTLYESNANTNAFNDTYKSKLDNTPVNTNTELSTLQSSINTNSGNISTLQTTTNNLQNDKFDKAGGQISGTVSLVSNNIEISNTGTGEGYLAFFNTSAPLNKKAYELNPRSSGYLGLETNDESNVKQNEFRFYHDGNFTLDGTITQNGNAVLDASDKTTNISDTTGKLPTAQTVKSYVDSNIQTFNGGTITNALIANGGISTNQLTLQADNTTLLLKNSSGESTFHIEHSGTTKEDLNFVETGVIANRLVLRKGGNVGIGTATPTQKLDVIGTVKATALSVSGNGTFTGTLTATGLDINGNADVSGSLTVNGNNVLVLNSLGRLAGQLQIDTNTFPQLKLSNDSNNLQSGIGYQDESGNYKASTYYDESGGFFRFKYGSSSSATSLPETFRYDQNGIYLNEGISLNLQDERNISHRFEKNTTSVNGAVTGMSLRAFTNPSAGQPIFRVESSGNSPRLHVEHDGIVGTSNNEIRVGISNDGTGGRTVFEEGNFSLLSRAFTYMQDFPTVSTTDVVNWCGRKVYMVGVGSGTVAMPPIVDQNPTATQVLEGESFILFNFNSGSNIAFTAASGQKFMIDNVSSGNISPSGGTFTVFASSAVMFTALDLRGYSNVSAYCWAVRGI